MATRARRLGKWIVVVALVGLGIVATRAWLAWPDVSAVSRESDVAAEALIHARAQGAAVEPVWAPMRQISPQLALAVLVAEDIEFFQHHGFSVAEMRMALRDARAGGRVRGASTITQQLARTLWLSSSRTVGRKVREAVLAADLERFLTKQRILELYLNAVPFGPGVYGAEAAARYYFHKSALFLNERESAELAAGLTQPSRWYPGVTSPDYLDRVELIRRRMANAEFLWRHLLRV